MKICFINTNIAWGGGEKWHFTYSKKLLSLGFDVSFISHPNSELYKELSKTQINLIGLKVSKYSFLNPFFNSEVKSIFKKYSFHSIIMNLPQDVKAFAKSASALGIKNIIYRRGMDHPIKASLLNKIIYKKYVTCIIANSQNVKKSVYKNIPELEEKIEILYNGVSLSEIPPVVRRNDSILKLGNLGRLVEQKGQMFLIELAKLLNKKSFNFQILIAGTGPLKEKLQNYINENNLQNKVKLLGHTKPDDFFKMIDFFVFPSLFEGLSNALLEAQLYRKPTFAFDISSNSEIIKDDYNGYLSQESDIEDIANKILLLAGQDEKIKMIQSSCLENLRSKFDEKLLLDQLIEIISK